MSRRSASRRAWQFLLLAAAIGIALQPIGLDLTRVLTDVQKSPLLWQEGDWACLELGTLRATRFTQTLGVYSRYGGAHLGPLYFYWLAPFYVSFGRNATAMSLGVLMLHLCIVLLLLVILHAAFARHRCRLIFSASLLLGIYLRLIPLDSIWNPDVLALPFCLFLCATALLSAGYAPALPLVFLVGSFCIQTHFATLPCCVSLAATSILLFATRTYRGETWSQRSVARWIGLTAVVALAVWLPPLVEDLHASPGNLRTFIRYVRSSSAEVGWFEGAAIMAAKVSWAAAVAKTGAMSPQNTPIQILSWILTALQCGGSVAIYYSKASCSYCRSLSTVTAVAILSALVTAANIRLGVYDPLTDWMSAIGLVGYSLLLTACLPARWRLNRCPAARPDQARPATEETRYVLPAIVGLLLLVLAGTAIHNSLFVTGPLTPRGSLRVRDLSQSLIAYLKKNGFHRPLILTDPDRLKWRVTTGIGLQLVKASQGFSLEINRLGSDSRPSRTDDGVVLITDKPCLNKLCVAIASDVRPASEGARVPPDGDTFVSSLEFPSGLSARRLADSLADLFGRPPRQIPAPLAEVIWTVIHSATLGQPVYSMSPGSHPGQLEALQQVSLFPSGGDLWIVASGYRPSMMTEVLDLRKEGIYVVLVDITVDHDDFGQLFYGRASRAFGAEDSTIFSLFKGRNLVGIPLPVPTTLERIRFHPGHRPGRYILGGFSIKRLPGGTVLTR